VRASALFACLRAPWLRVSERARLIAAPINSESAKCVAAERLETTTTTCKCMRAPYYSCMATNATGSLTVT